MILTGFYKEYQKKKKKANNQKSIKQNLFKISKVWQKIAWSLHFFNGLEETYATDNCI